MSLRKAQVRNAHAEAVAALGSRGGDARVLEPSPPAASEPPWFADDPTARRPLDWSGIDWVDAGWRRERWLGPFRRLRPLQAAFASTRDALHELAVKSISPPREAVNAKIGLRWTLGGFGTPFFGEQEQWRVEDGLLVHQFGDQVTREKHPRSGVDAAAAAALGEFYGFAISVLEAVRASAGAVDPSRVQLWPEHFDISVEIGTEAAGARAGHGASPGDSTHAEPYLYVLPWGEAPSGERWQARGYAGAELDYAELLAAADQRALALEFFGERLAELARRH